MSWPSTLRRRSKTVGPAHRFHDSLGPMRDRDAFIADGYIKLEAVVSRGAADAARALLWRQLGLSPDDPGRWTLPVRWASDMTGEGPFGELIQSPVLASALDQICGAG